MILPWDKRANTQLQIQKYKYTITQIQHINSAVKTHHVAYFWKRGLFKDNKNHIPMCQTGKYKNTNTHIHKYTNTAYNEVSERPNMWHIFEKRIVQGYQKWYSRVSNMQIQKYKYKIHKYTNTAYDEVSERPNMWFIFEEGVVQG